MKKSLIIIASLFVLASCVYPYEATLKGTEQDIVVLEGSIVVGGVSTVKISKMRPIDTDSFIPGKTKGTAWVEDDQGGRYNSSSTEASNLINIPMENARSGRKYRMMATVEGETYASDWMDIVPPPVIEDVTFSSSNRSTDVIVGVTLNGGEAATGYIGLTYEETWEFHTDYLCRYELDTTRWRVYERTTEYPNYWCWANAASTDMTLVDYTQISGDRIVEFPLHSFPRTSGRNHKKYSIKVNAVTLPAATYRYLKNLQDITQGSGSLFSPNPGEMASNIICESNPDLSVLGYVTTSLSTSKRAFLDSRYYTPLMPPTNYLFISENFREDYEYGYYPVDLMILPRGENGEDVEGVYWGPLRCIDCIEAGGTKEKPDFWE